MSIVEQCAAAMFKCAVNDAGREYPDWESATTENREIALKCMTAGLAEFARLAQSPEMVESVSGAAGWHPIVIRKVLAALFREAGVSGGGES